MNWSKWAPLHYSSFTLNWNVHTFMRFEGSRECLKVGCVFPWISIAKGKQNMSDGASFQPRHRFTLKPQHPKDQHFQIFRTEMKFSNYNLRKVSSIASLPILTSKQTGINNKSSAPCGFGCHWSTCNDLDRPMRLQRPLGTTRGPLFCLLTVNKQIIAVFQPADTHTHRHGHPHTHRRRNININTRKKRGRGNVVASGLVRVLKRLKMETKQEKKRRKARPARDAFSGPVLLFVYLPHWLSVWFENKPPLSTLQSHNITTRNCPGVPLPVDLDYLLFKIFRSIIVVTREWLFTRFHFGYDTHSRMLTWEMKIVLLPSRSPTLHFHKN